MSGGCRTGGGQQGRADGVGVGSGKTDWLGKPAGRAVQTSADLVPAGWRLPAVRTGQPGSGETAQAPWLAVPAGRTEARPRQPQLRNNVPVHLQQPQSRWGSRADRTLTPVQSTVFSV